MTLTEYAAHLSPTNQAHAAQLVRDAKIKCWLMGIDEDNRVMLFMLARGEKYDNTRAEEILKLIK